MTSAYPVGSYLPGTFRVIQARGDLRIGVQTTGSAGRPVREQRFTIARIGPRGGVYTLLEGSLEEADRYIESLAFAAFTLRMDAQRLEAA